MKVPRVLPALLLAGCADFATPAELAAPTIIAVIADPPLVPPGATSRVEVVVAGPDGQIPGLVPRWALVESYPTYPPMGTLAVDGDAALYAAPDQLPDLPEDLPPIDTLRLEVDVVVDGAARTLVAVKAMAVVDAVAANPVITGLVDGDGAPLAPSIRVVPGAGLTVELRVEPTPTDEARFAWYTTWGEIVDYQQNPTRISMPAEVGAGTLFAVIRDGTGGVAWTSRPIATGD